MNLLNFKQLFLANLIVTGLFIPQSNAEAAGIQEETIDIPSPNQSNDAHSQSPSNSGNKIIEDNIGFSNSPTGSSPSAEDAIINVPDTKSDAANAKQHLVQQKKAAAQKKPEEEGYVDTTATKLGGGVLDIATSWLELPKTIVKVTKEEGLAAGLTVGFAKGIANTAEQAVSGAVNVATFPVPKKVEIDVVENPGDEFDMEKTFGAAFKNDKDAKSD